MISFWQILIFLLAGIAVIILLTAKYRVPAFFALLLACFVVGLGCQLPITDVLNTVKDGFGNIMKSLALLIILGTTLGVLLEHTGSTRTMAEFLFRLVGEKRGPLAVSITGFIVGLPIFCDSGYIVLSGLNKSLARRTGASMSVMAVSMATGLYSVHCLLPPHPGASAAAGTIGVDFGALILIGMIVAIPASIAGYWWAIYAGRKEKSVVDDTVIEETRERKASVIQAFLPVLVPIILIAVRSFFILDPSLNSIAKSLLILGEPVVALTIGILLTFTYRSLWNSNSISTLLQESVEKAAGILVIIGAGGAFGAILAATRIGDHFSSAIPLGSIGIFFPFLLTFILKTAQGSSTVAIITAASIVQPLLVPLGLAEGYEKIFCVLAMGAGSMMISHANDAYFWVVAKFSSLDMKTMLRCYTMASIWMGITAFIVVYLMHLFF
jgi:GntP family gluconate:H+ symporter